MWISNRAFRRSGSSRNLGNPRRRGAAAVEFAIVGSGFFLLVLGIIEFGRGIMVVHQLNDAARNGCRTGIILGKSTTDIKSAVNSYLSTVGITQHTVTTEVNGTAADASTAKSEDELTVVVSISADKVTWLPGTKYIQNSLSGQFTMRRE